MSHATRSGTLPSRVRAATIPDSLGTITGHAAVFNTWSEIQEGGERFLERVQPGAFRDTTRDPSGVRILLSHGYDPFVGSRPIATLDELTEDSVGLRYQGQLFPTLAGFELLPLLKAGVMGASYRFSIPAGGDQWVDGPSRSAHNPGGLPERTIVAATVHEVGPTPFPAFPTTTAGIKPLTTPSIQTNSSTPPRRTTRRPANWYLPPAPKPTQAWRI